MLLLQGNGGVWFGPVPRSVYGCVSIDLSRVGAGGTNYVGGSTAGDQRLGLNEWGYYSGIDTLRIVSQTTNKPTQQKTFDVNYIDIPMQRAGTTHTHTQTTNRTHNT